MTAQAAPVSLLAIGHVARAHGLRGELRVDLDYSGSEALADAERVWLGRDRARPDAAAAYAVEWARPVPRAFLVKLEGVADRNAAELLRGMVVWVDRAEVPTEDGEYFLVDLVGAKVIGPEGEIGTVVEVATHPSVDALVIKAVDGRTLEQPLVPQFVARVSVEERVVELSTLDGLIT